ncbi:MAG: hypothetical protein K8R59_14060 [Thermoanaerobaculales bacterium]|nr:hypothetical protein [Thermoanaerobaculales bacterium]
MRKVCRPRSAVFCSVAFLSLAILHFLGGVADAKELRIMLRVEPEMKLEGTERIYVGPILLEPGAEGVEAEGLDVIAAREFDRYLRRLLRRETRLTVLNPIADLDLPTKNPLELAQITSFWMDIGRETGAEYIVTAAIDVAVLDRAGYQTEEYVSPQDGKTYFRQVLIEETGFSYDILVTVLDGENGKVVFSEQITDFQEKSERKLEVFTDMFSDLYTLDNRLLAIFVPRFIRAKRYLFK